MGWRIYIGFRVYMGFRAFRVSGFGLRLEHSHAFSSATGSNFQAANSDFLEQNFLLYYALPQTHPNTLLAASREEKNIAQYV